MPEKTIKLPGLGPTKASRVYLGGLVVAGSVIAWVWYQRRQAAATDASIPVDAGAAASDGTATTGVDTGAPVGAYTNPITGFNNHPLSNADWTQQAIQALTGIGYDPVMVASALGLYLNNQAVTQAQADLIRTAIAYLGPPPVGSYAVQISSTAPPPVTTNVVEGELIRATGDNKVYVITGGQKHWIPDQATLKASYAGQTIVTVTPEVRDAIPTGSDIPKYVPTQPTQPTQPVTGTHHYAIEFHRVGNVGTSVNPRAYVQEHSDPSVATPNNIQTALAATMADSRNKSLKQPWPGGSAVYVTVVKAG